MDERRTGSDVRNLPTPDWVPTDDVITERPDKQVLVVGDTVVGLTLTLLLRHAGYDPLVVNGTAPPVSSRTTYLCPPAVRTLDAVGVGTSVRDCGTTVESVFVNVSTSQSDPTVLSMGTEQAETMPLVVRTDRLRRALETRLPEQQHRGDRAVETVSRRDGGLVVKFRDGIHEWFDVVVDAGGGGDALRPTGAESPASDPLAQYELPLDTVTLTQAGIRDHWRSDALIQAFQSQDDSGGTLRITTPCSDIERVLADVNPETGPPSETDLVSEGAEFESTRIQHMRASDAVADWWGSGQVAFCGRAACPVAPASGFDVTIGIEDAIAFVTELNDTTQPVSDIVDTYSSRRADRLTTLRDRVESVGTDHQYPLPGSTRPPLASLGALRVVTLGSFLGTPMDSIQREGFKVY
ncbi:FAD-dependent oxidoreductase [Halosimplex halobium]|uniref:FAD-dependent oxidoreductase n=1 Tax=Halosimplex halobium TaxID=3396618 RepID=UPI003F5545C6